MLEYQDRPVEKERIEAFLRAAMQAPFAGDQQAREFRAVTEKDIIEKLSTVSPCAGCTTGAPAVIVAAYREDCMMPEYARIDLFIAMENLWLETDGQGFGGVWLGIAPSRRA